MGSKNNILILIVGESVSKLHRFVSRILDDRFECFMLPDEFHDMPLSPVKMASILDNINKQPNLILFNTKSKGGFDYNIYRFINCDLYTSHIPKLVIANNQTQSEYYIERHSRTHDYIIKPFDKADLTSRIDKLIASLNLQQYQTHMMLDGDECINRTQQSSLSAEDLVFLKSFRSSLEDYSHHKLDKLDFVNKIMGKMDFPISMLGHKLYSLLGEHLTGFLAKHKLEFLSISNITELVQMHRINRMLSQYKSLTNENKNENSSIQAYSEIYKTEISDKREVLKAAAHKKDYLKKRIAK